MRELFPALSIIVSNNISTIKNNSEIIKSLLEESKKIELERIDQLKTIESDNT